MEIKILTMGGTIDKAYFDANSEFQVGDPEILRVLEEANVSFEYSLESVLRKDSLEMTDDDRQLLLQRIMQTKQERILITHGTDTMVDTALALHGCEDKTIVFTGAMQPARLRVSDAIFNIGCAVTALQLLDHGVYIAMNGRVFDSRSVRKNLAMQRFEAI